ncbi:MAG: hypothetical protein HY674_20000 [Chloroflexi bacterium]|nr:hypothetical protein [Chloroflexota bacterium]
MNVMSKFRRSWLLFKSSVWVIARNKKLLVFPIVICACTVVIALFFIAPAVLRPTGYGYVQAEHWQAIGHSLLIVSEDPASRSQTAVGLTPAAMAYLAFLYFMSMFTATFFNVAFYSEILAALSGEAVSIGRGLKFACTRWKSILMWSLFAGLVGLIIKALEEKFQVAGRFVARLIGLAWSVAAVFVIPVIVREEQSVNPVHTLRKSAGVLKRTWGEALIGYAGLTFGNLLIGVGSLALLGGALAASIVWSNFWIIAVTGAVWLLAIVAWSYLTGVASQVYKGALYLYAAEGVVADPYNREMLDSAWKFKKS